MRASTAWKDEFPAIRTLASAVNERSPEQRMSARTAARALFGPVGLASARHGVDAMQRACAELVACKAAWTTKFGTLPRDATGRVSEPIALIASMARGLLPLAGVDHLRSALAFWASEDDPARWQEMVPND